VPQSSALGKLPKDAGQVNDPPAAAVVVASVVVVVGVVTGAAVVVVVVVVVARQVDGEVHFNDSGSKRVLPGQFCR